MKVELLRNDRNRQVLPIPEGNRGGSSQFNLCKGKNLTTRHLGARRAPRVATVHDAVKELDRVLPHPSAIFHAYASTDTPWVARTLFHCTPRKRGKVSSNSMTHEATQFAGIPKNLIWASTRLKLAHQGQTIGP
jgi:hypothetical protein